MLITTDQQRFDTLNAWGNQSIFTPHLNYMAAMGISYKNCYASCPICVPSRTTIMTGRQGYESGVISNETHETFMRACTEERSTLPAVLTDAGGQVLESAIRGARGMTDAGAREVFFEFNALDTYPEPMYLAAGDARIRIK